MTAEELEKLKNVDIRDIDRDSLVDINTIKIDEREPVEKRICSFVEQVKNPYCFKVGGIVVKVGFNPQGPTFEEQFNNMIAGFM